MSHSVFRARAFLQRMFVDASSTASMTDPLHTSDLMEQIDEEPEFWRMRVIQGPNRDMEGWIPPARLEEILPSKTIDKSAFYRSLDLAARLYSGMDPRVLYGIAFVETEIDNPTTKEPIGPFQYKREVWAEEIARPLEEKYFPSDITDPFSQTVVTTRRCLRLADQVHARHGRDPIPAELRLAHMLPGVIVRLLGDPARTVREHLEEHYRTGGAAALQAEAKADAIIAANNQVFRVSGRDLTVSQTLAGIDVAMRPGLDAAQKHAQQLGGGNSEVAGGSVTLTNAAAGNAPQWLTVALNEMASVPPVVDGSQRIRDYFGIIPLNVDPSTAWCAAFVSFCLGTAGVTLPNGQQWSAWAADWLKKGTPLTRPQLGAIVVIPSPSARSGRHVGFASGWNVTTNQITLLAGNQSGRREDGDGISEKQIVNGPDIVWRWPT